MKKRIVIKLSGQVFGMERTKELKDYAAFFVKQSKICQPVIVAGGGKIARYFINHARSSGADESTLDELGIEISRLNAKLLIYALKDNAYPHPPTNLTEVKQAVDSGLIVVTGGLHPGQSTNGTAALIAEKINAAEFLNATDVDGIYDSDPNKNKKAKQFKRIELKDLRSLLVHEDSMAGGYDLMDIVALKVIERSKIKTKIIKSDIKTIEKAIKGLSIGTEIIL
ncbi:MAG: UMP kinase [Thaumarchaeota archaeon]|jgi:uridylate kinase|nr:MAG: UMP kinase [Nitrososphaerota archaeon]HIA10052.1 UMP kinase [Candidatus Nitrosopelagicus sp.]HIA97485.1 UMP kinase [Candidatus Nitrosopelagicus sp.]HIC05874.1 UMP kinase [Candidatus Nitrosopelagicus sp.]HIO85378.1 UMP kinase [Candidatus Nitrosopelagicus sp.]|tara:strand:- start:2967 stop:3641 length:675 start_codon:yes stop_codon:yes gene_type:complete